ncbi:hypothetical protein EJB05_02076, partial [Eragrostis curvula]
MEKRSPPPTSQPSPPAPVCSPPSPSSSNSSSISVEIPPPPPCKRAKRTHHKSAKQQQAVKAKRPRKDHAKDEPSSAADPPPNAAAAAAAGKRSSIYRGVTRHRWTGRFEAHLWDKHCLTSLQSKKKGRQGAYDSEEAAARAYDLAALKYWGPETVLNFPEYLAALRRRSSGFSRGVSKYRGVARHHHNGRWEARIGRVFGNKYLYLGTFEPDSSEVQEPESSETKTPDDIAEPISMVDIEESLWSPCMNYELDTMSRSTFGSSINLSD